MRRPKYKIILFPKKIPVKNKFGTYKLSQKDFEDLCIYLSDPELYLNTKKYNL